MAETMSQNPSNMVQGLVLREIEAGQRDDGLWLQAMSEHKLDKAKAQVRYIELRAQALQANVKGLLIQQIRGAVAQDSSVRLNNASLADYLASKTLKPTGKK
jgi:3-dehydroquinate dehydratase